MKVLKNLLIVVLDMLWQENILFISQQKIPFLKSMMVNSRISSRKFMNKLIESSMKRRKYGMNID
jgi:hypothetical protein